MGESFLTRKGMSGGGVGNYSTWVVQDEAGAKYVAYNGYDFVTNPTPSSTNLTYNQWLLNNSASGTIVLSNTVMALDFYNGPNTVVNESNIATPDQFSSPTFSGNCLSVAHNGNYAYAALSGLFAIRKYHLSNLRETGIQTNSYGGVIFATAINNGFVYAAGAANGRTLKYHESNLVLVGNTVNYGSNVSQLAINNGFIYATGGTDIKKYHEGNLVFVGNSASYGATILSMAINNGFVFIGGFGNNTVRRYHESNLVLANSSVDNFAPINAITIDDGFVYASYAGGGTIRRFFENNLATSATSTFRSGNGSFFSLSVSGNFIYGSGDTNTAIHKYHKSNLVFLAGTQAFGGIVRSLKATNQNEIIVGGNLTRLSSFVQKTASNDVQTYYTITNVKE